MKSIIPIIALAGIVGLGGTAHAEGLGSAVGDCTSVTFTSAPGTRMLLNTDAEPPIELLDGASGTFTLFPYFTEHYWTFVVFQDGSPEIVDRGTGHVTGCAALEYPTDPGNDTVGSKVAGTPAAEPVVAEIGDPVAPPIEVMLRYGPF